MCSPEKFEGNGRKLTNTVEESPGFLTALRRRAPEGERCPRERLGYGADQRWLGRKALGGKSLNRDFGLLWLTDESSGKAKSAAAERFVLPPHYSQEHTLLGDH